jgi:hypothetical protein
MAIIEKELNVRGTIKRELQVTIDEDTYELLRQLAGLENAPVDEVLQKIVLRQIEKTKRHMDNPLNEPPD